jgi:hypothetical protein
MTEIEGSRRLELVGAAQRQWIAALTDLGGRNTLLYYKDRRARTTASAATASTSPPRIPTTRPG